MYVWSWKQLHYKPPCICIRSCPKHKNYNVHHCCLFVGIFKEMKLLLTWVQNKEGWWEAKLQLQTVFGRWLVGERLHPFVESHRMLQQFLFCLGEASCCSIWKLPQLYKPSVANTDVSREAAWRYLISSLNFIVRLKTSTSITVLSLSRANSCCRS